MAINEREGLFEHSVFKGLRNNVGVDSFDLGDLSIAENVDIDDAGGVGRRKGHSAAVIAGACKSLWTDGTRLLAVQDETSLIDIQPDYSINTLRTVTAGLDMSYAGLAGRVYYSNGVDLGVVDDGHSRSWGLAAPTGQPVAAATGGVLPAGTYQYAVTFLRADGQESGTPVAATITLADIGGISLTAIPVSSDPDVTHVAVYFSKCDGDTLYRAGRMSNGTTAFSYQIEASMQVPLRTQHLRAPVPGQFVGAFNGRTLVALDDTLYYSEPYAPELFDLRKHYRFGAAITMLAPLENGVYVGTRERVIWLAGKVPEQWVHLQRASYGVMRGAFSVVDKDTIMPGQGSEPVAAFATTQGIALGSDGGMITNLTHDRFSYPIQDRGAVVIRRHRGMVQCLAALQGTEQAGNAAV